MSYKGTTNVEIMEVLCRSNNHEVPIYCLTTSPKGRKLLTIYVCGYSTYLIVGRDASVKEIGIAYEKLAEKALDCYKQLLDYPRLQAPEEVLCKVSSDIDDWNKKNQATVSIR